MPYLNGGLFDIEDDYDRALSTEERLRIADVDISNDAFRNILNLFPRPSEGRIAALRKHVENETKAIAQLKRSGANAEVATRIKKLKKSEAQLAAWDKAGAEQETGFDWAVEFAEVFMPEASETWRMDDLHPLINDFHNQGTLLEEANPDASTGGFDIVLANPPYVRMELFKPISPPPEFAHHAPRADPQHFIAAQDETLALTERIAKAEREIDERVAALYGVSLDKQD